MPKRSSATRKKLTWWQDEFWKHMVKKYPDLERGESASETGRTHIPPRLFKEAVHLNRMKDQIMAILERQQSIQQKGQSRRTGGASGQVYPRCGGHADEVEKYDKTYKELTAENAELEKEAFFRIQGECAEEA